MRAALPLEDRERAVALDREDGLLHAAPVALVRGEDLRAIAAALGIPLEHACHLAGPERRLVAADPLPHLDDHVLRVGRVTFDERELELVLQARDLVGKPVRERGELGIVPGGREVGRHLLPLAGHPDRRLELLQAPPDVRRFAVIVVDGRVRHPLLELGVRALELLDEVIESQPWRRNSRCAAKRRTAMPRLCRGERRVERDLGNPGERLRDGAVDLRALGVLDEGRVIDARARCRRRGSRLS